MNAENIFCQQLIECGLREYDAVIYVTLFTVGIANAAELHELTGIPRGRVYETLAILQKNGFVGSTGKNPIMYFAEDMKKTFFQVLEKNNMLMKNLSNCIAGLEQVNRRPAIIPPGSIFQTETAIEKQISLMCHRAKTEIVILCNDNDFLDQHAEEFIFAEKRIPVYVILNNNEGRHASSSSLSYYVAGNFTDASLFSPLGNSPSAPKMILQMFVDRKNSFVVLESDGLFQGLYAPGYLHAEFLVKSLLRDAIKQKNI